MEDAAAVAGDKCVGGAPGPVVGSAGGPPVGRGDPAVEGLPGSRADLFAGPAAEQVGDLIVGVGQEGRHGEQRSVGEGEGDGHAPVGADEAVGPPGRFGPLGGHGLEGDAGPPRPAGPRAAAGDGKSDGDAAPGGQAAQLTKRPLARRIVPTPWMRSVPATRSTAQPNVVEQAVSNRLALLKRGWPGACPLAQRR